MNSKMLIAGCSHAAGSEIDGELDSKFNRNNSFGNLLASHLNREPINIAIGGAANPTIARSVINYIEKNINQTDDLFVLVSWTDSSRVEVPIDWKYGFIPEHADWIDPGLYNFTKITLGTPKSPIEKENEIFDYWKKFCAENDVWLEIYSLQIILMIQFYLKSKNIPYVMCNGGWVTRSRIHTDHYLNLIDRSKYYEYDDPDKSFIVKYKNLGYKNNLAKYWHHGAEPHRLYAKELLDFIYASKQ